MTARWQAASGTRASRWNPDWISHEVSDLADDAGVDLSIKTLRHYTASQLLAAVSAPE